MCVRVEIAHAPGHATLVNRLGELWWRRQRLCKRSGARADFAPARPIALWHPPRLSAIVAPVVALGRAIAAPARGGVPLIRRYSSFLSGSSLLFCKENFALLVMLLEVEVSVDPPASRACRGCVMRRTTLGTHMPPQASVGTVTHPVPRETALVAQNSRWTLVCAVFINSSASQATFVGALTHQVPFLPTDSARERGPVLLLPTQIIVTITFVRH